MVENASAGMNAALRCLHPPLARGDKVIYLSTEYGMTHYHTKENKFKDTLPPKLKRSPSSGPGRVTQAAAAVLSSLVRGVGHKVLRSVFDGDARVRLELASPCWGDVATRLGLPNALYAVSTATSG